jgi:squalene-associated FAD-dependent desaturase
LKKKVVIIGGGLAGLSAGVFLKEADKDSKLEISLYEGSPKFGGRTYSFYDEKNEVWLDNGQHILAGWYKDTLDYLKITGSINKLNFQNKLEISFYENGGKNVKLNCPKTFAPLNMFLGLFGYEPLSSKDKLRFLKILKLINRDKYPDEYLKAKTVQELLNELKQGDNAIKYFWEPFLLAVFNTKIDKINASVFVNVLAEGFSRVNSANLLIPHVDLSKLLINEAVEELKKKDVEIENNNRVSKLNIQNDNIMSIDAEKGMIENFDYVVSAVPFFRFRELFDENDFAKYFEYDFEMKHSSIVSVHLFFENEINEHVLKNNSFGMSGLLGTNTQWIFKRNDKHLSLVISGADFLEHNGKRVIDMDAKEIYEMCKNELSECLSGFRGLSIKDYKVVKEKRATFIPDIDSERFRYDAETKIENLFLAGDWTNTGLPSTIESAIRSGRKTAGLIINKVYK